MEAKQFIATIRKEKKMTQAELAEQIHVTDKAISRWERGGGFPDIQTLEPLAQALGISILELMRSEKMEQEEGQEKQDRNANVIAGLLVFGVAAVAWAAKLTNLGGGLVLGGLVATVFVSLWYFFQNMDDKESRRIYGAASVLSVGILMALIHYAWGDRIAEALPGGVEKEQQIFWTVWYLFLIATVMTATFRSIRRQKQKKEKKYKTVAFAAVMAVILFGMLWQYQNTMQGQHRNLGIWSGAEQYAENLLKIDKDLENDWLIGDESWQEGKNTYHIRLSYYANEEDARQGYESTYEYVIGFDEMDGFIVKSEGVLEKELDLSKDR